MEKHKFIILLIIFCTSGLKAQTVEEFISMAKSYNPGLKALKLDYEAMLQKADQVRDWPDPTVSLGLGVLPVETRLGAQIFKVGGTQMIPWKGLLNAKSEVANANAAVLQNMDDVKEIDIEYAIRTTYLSLQFLEERKSIINARLGVLDILEELAKSAVRSGKGKLSNVLLIQRQREMLNANLKLLDTKKEQPIIMLNRWTGRAYNQEIQVRLSADDIHNREDLLDYASNAHPQFQILDQRIKASNASIALTKFESKPKIGVGLDYAYVARRSDVEIPGNGRDILMPMGSISIPLHTGRFDAQRQEERIKQEAISMRRKELQDQFTAEIEAAYAIEDYSEQVIAKYLSLKDITRETLKLMRTEYASEGTRFEELLRLEMELIDYDLEILNAEFEKKTATVTFYKFK